MYSNATPYICWVKEKGKPRILGFVDRFFASTGGVNHHTRRQFDKIVGEEAAKMALSRFYEEEDTVAGKKPNQVGRA